MQLTIYHKDSRDMSELNTGTIGLIVTSPPYWNIIDYAHPKQLGPGLTYSHFLLLLEKTLLECMRVLKEDTFAIFIVGDIRTKSGYQGIDSRPKIYPLHADIIHYFLKMGFDFFSHYIWRKKGINKPSGKIVYGSVGNGEYKGYAVPPFLYSDLMMEHIMVFRKPGRRNIPPIWQRFLNKHNVLRIEDVRTWVDPVWVLDSPTNPGHPATCPLEIVSRLIKMHSMAGDIVLDPFMGTGTTLDVALKHGRHAIGYEINDDYIDAYLRRNPELQPTGNNCFLATDILRQPIEAVQDVLPSLDG